MKNGSFHWSGAINTYHDIKTIPYINLGATSFVPCMRGERDFNGRDMKESKRF